MDERKGAARPDEQAGVQGVLDRILERVRRGDRLDSAQLAQEFPEHEEEIPRLIGVVRFVHGASAGMRPLGDLDLCLALGETPEINGFRILREVARGGMGTVYEAIEVAVERRIALKVLGTGSEPSRRELQRFLREERTVAGLQHPHIIPILSVGEINGVPYYAMPFVEGQSLAELIGERRAKDTRADAAWSRRAAGWARDVAEALAHAHAAGVIHRDIKPSNVIIDVAGSAWVTDFGLARRPVDASLTRSEDLVGTLRYMAPEQARGVGRLDERSDVYALGATLFELLALVPPHAGEEREEILRAVLLEDAPSLRKLAPEVPRDLATIVHKALAKGMEGRYPSAEFMARDLERFLEGRAILARSPSLLEHLKVLDRRHRVSFRSLLGAVLALFVLSLIVSIQALRISADRERIQVQSEHANRVRNFLETVLFYANPKGSTPVDTMDDLLDHVSDRLGTEFQDDPRTQAELRTRIGELYWARSRFEEAERELVLAVELGQRPGEAADDNTILAQISLAGLLGFLERREEGLALLDQVEGELASGAPHQDLDRTRAELLAGEGKPDAALASANRALAEEEAMFGSGDPRSAATLELIGRLQADLNRLDDAIGVERGVARLLNSARGPADQGTFLANCTTAEYLFLRRQPGDLSEAEALLTAAIDAYSQAPEPTPVDLAWARGRLADVLSAAGRDSDADRFYSQAANEMRSLVGQHVLLAQVLRAWGRHLIHSGRPGEATAPLAEALQIEKQRVGAGTAHARETRALLRSAREASRPSSSGQGNR